MPKAQPDERPTEDGRAKNGRVNDARINTAAGQPGTHQPGTAKSGVSRPSAANDVPHERWEDHALHRRPALLATPEEIAIDRAAATAKRRAFTLSTSRLSMRLRLTLWVVLINTLVIFSTELVFWLYQTSAIEQATNERRIRRSRMIAAELRPYVPDNIAQRLAGVSSELTRQFIGERFMIEVFDSSGQSLASTGPERLDAATINLHRVLASDSPFVVKLEPGAIWPRSESETPTRIVTTTMRGSDGNTYAIALAVTDSFVDDQVRYLRSVFIVLLLVGVIAAGISGWFIASIAVAPFERLRRLASNLMPDASTTSLAVDSVGGSSEVMRLAEELDLARARVRDRFAAQDRFISNVSHEIKTPIAVMLTEAQVLDRRGLPQPVERFIDSVEEEMSKLGRLVESFLTLTRIQDGKGLVRFSAYGVNDLIMDSLDDCVRMAEQHHVTIQPELLADDSTLDLAVSGEPELLRTMLNNLVRNAIRFSPNGGTVRIRAIAGTRSRNEEQSETDQSRSEHFDTVKLVIADEGPGIPPDRINLIFDRFSQASNQPMKGRGHGLGLTIALGIAEMHAGSIVAENLPKAGCRFIVSLPLRGIDPTESSDVAMTD